jgi:ketosteroid isomerase-like protein
VIDTNPVERYYEALSRGDIAGVLGCFTPDARVWHCFDGVAEDLDTTAKNLTGLVGGTDERGIEDVSVIPTEDGFVQRHVFVLRTRDGVRRAWPVCLVVRTENGLIRRLDEYIDRAGAFTPDEGPVRTPGL